MTYTWTKIHSRPMYPTLYRTIEGSPTLLTTPLINAPYCGDVITYTMPIRSERHHPRRIRQPDFGRVSYEAGGDVVGVTVVVVLVDAGGNNGCFVLGSLKPLKAASSVNILLS